MNNYRDKRSEDNSYNKGGRNRSDNVLPAMARIVPLTATTTRATVSNSTTVPIVAQALLASVTTVALRDVTTKNRAEATIVVPVSVRTTVSRQAIVPRTIRTTTAHHVAKDTTLMVATANPHTARVLAVAATMQMPNTTEKNRLNIKRLSATPMHPCV